MLLAEDIQQIRSGLWFWQAYDPTVKCDLSSCALRTENDFVLIDPIRLAGDALKQLTRIAAPTRILITNANHARQADFYRDLLRIPVMAHPAACAEMEIPVDEHFIEGDRVAGFSITSISGAPSGEVAVHSPDGVMIVGDALINVEPHGFTFLPDKYCLDAKVMHISLRKLLRFDFEVLTFAHGLPVVDRARQRLETLTA